MVVLIITFGFESFVLRLAAVRVRRQPRAEESADVVALAILLVLLSLGSARTSAGVPRVFLREGVSFADFLLKEP